MEQLCKEMSDEKRRGRWALTSILPNIGAMPTAKWRLGAVSLMAWRTSLAGAAFVSLCKAARLLKFTGNAYLDRDPALLTGV